MKIVFAFLFGVGLSSSLLFFFGVVSTGLAKRGQEPEQLEAMGSGSAPKIEDRPVQAPRPAEDESGPEAGVSLLERDGVAPKKLLLLALAASMAMSAKVEAIKVTGLDWASAPKIRDAAVYGTWPDGTVFQALNETLAHFKAREQRVMSERAERDLREEQELRERAEREEQKWQEVVTLMKNQGMEDDEIAEIEDSIKFSSFSPLFKGIKSIQRIQHIMNNEDPESEDPAEWRSLLLGATREYETLKKKGVNETDVMQLHDAITKWMGYDNGHLGKHERLKKSVQEQLNNVMSARPVQAPMPADDESGPEAGVSLLERDGVSPKKFLLAVAPLMAMYADVESKANSARINHMHGAGKQAYGTMPDGKLFRPLDETFGDFWAREQKVTDNLVSASTEKMRKLMKKQGMSEGEIKELEVDITKLLGHKKGWFSKSDVESLEYVMNGGNPGHKDSAERALVTDRVYDSLRKQGLSDEMIRELQSAATGWRRDNGAELKKKVQKILANRAAMSVALDGLERSSW